MKVYATRTSDYEGPHVACLSKSELYSPDGGFQGKIEPWQRRHKIIRGGKIEMAKKQDHPVACSAKKNSRGNPPICWPPIPCQYHCCTPSECFCDAQSPK